MRLQVVALPQIVDGRLAHPRLGRHRTATPMRCTCWLGLHRFIEQALDLFCGIGRLASSPRSNIPQTTNTVGGEPLLPKSNGMAIYHQLLSDRSLGVMVGRAQDNTAAKCHLLGRSHRTEPLS